jgi:hypothetical protein
LNISESPKSDSVISHRDSSLRSLNSLPEEKGEGFAQHGSFSKHQVECLSSLNTEIVRSDISHESEETSYNNLNKIQAVYNSNLNTHINSSEEHTHSVEDGALPLIFPAEGLKQEEHHFLGNHIL